MSLKLLTALVVALAVAVGVGVAAQTYVNNAEAQEADGMTLTVRNVTGGNPLTPPVAVVHDGSVIMGASSLNGLTGLQELAEAGMQEPLATTLAGLDGVSEVVKLETSPIPGGEEATGAVMAMEGDYVTVVSMLACTNDAITVATAMVGADGGAAFGRVYDAGTEENSETAATVPCLGGEGVSEAGGEGSLMLHGGIMGGADLDQSHDWGVAAMHVFVHAAGTDDPSGDAVHTQALVQRAIDRYNTDGLAATAAYYNTPESRDGQWYVFIADRSGILRAHVTHIGWLLDRVLGPDGYPAGKMVNAVADEDGGWVSYTFVNPASGEVEKKHSWAILHDGILFGSGWHEAGTPKSDAAGYTREFVGRATDLYNVLGRDDTVVYYNTRKSVDEQWYVFIADENDTLIAHPTAPSLIGVAAQDLTTNNGYPSGSAIAAVADEDGGWTSYTWTNPATGQDEIKHTFAIRHGGLLFGSGWYEPSPSKDDPEAYTKAFAQQAVELHKAVGNDGAIAYYNMPESVDGDWYAFVVQGDTIVAHPTIPENVGQSLLGPLGTDSTGKEYGPAIVDAPEGGAWVDYTYLNPAMGEEEIKHTWVVRSGDLVFGSGWYEPIPPPTPTPVPTATPMPTATPAEETPETGDFSLTAGWALALALAGALIAFGGAATLARQRRR